MKYTIISKESTFELLLEVEKCIKEGWVPQGGISACENYGTMRYFQAMVKNV